MKKQTEGVDVVVVGWRKKMQVQITRELGGHIGQKVKKVGKNCKIDLNLF